MIELKNEMDLYRLYEDYFVSLDCVKSRASHAKFYSWLASKNLSFPASYARNTWACLVADFFNFAHNPKGKYVIEIDDNKDKMIVDFAEKYKGVTRWF